MAKAKVIPAKFKTELVEIEPEHIQFIISRDEAEVIHSMTGRFLANGPQSSIYDALGDVLGAEDGWSHWHKPKYEVMVNQEVGSEYRHAGTLKLVEAE